MPNELYFAQINPMEAIKSVSLTLRRIDERLMDHGERVAYIASNINKIGNFQLDEKTLFLLSVFHDVGAYKTDEIDKMLEFENVDVLNHSIYGYLFLKYLTPLREYSEAILYHHTPWKDLAREESAYENLASLIYLADRIDVSMTLNDGSITHIKNMLISPKAEDIFNPAYIPATLDFLKGPNLDNVLNGSYYTENRRLLETFQISPVEALEYLKMVVYSIDFRSIHTVTHTINTVSLALNLGRHYKLNEIELEEIYLGALLHDVGKISIPFSILESPGKLSDEQMAIMKTHVDETEKMISGSVTPKICNIACRHHEKLDGSGYPRGLSGEVLTLQERIVAVSDIVSALSSSRSYKEPFPKSKIISILGDMADSKLDPEICKYVIDNFDYILSQTNKDRINVIKQYQGITNEYKMLQEIM